MERHNDRLSQQTVWIPEGKVILLDIMNYTEFSYWNVQCNNTSYTAFIDYHGHLM